MTCTNTHTHTHTYLRTIFPCTDHHGGCGCVGVCECLRHFLRVVSAGRHGYDSIRLDEACFCVCVCVCVCVLVSVERKEQELCGALFSWVGGCREIDRLQAYMQIYTHTHTTSHGRQCLSPPYTKTHNARSRGIIVPHKALHRTAGILQQPDGGVLWVCGWVCVFVCVYVGGWVGG
jgi:hypothetical protein